MEQTWIAVSIDMISLLRRAPEPVSRQMSRGGLALLLLLTRAALQYSRPSTPRAEYPRILFDMALPARRPTSYGPHCTRVHLLRVYVPAWV